MILFIFVFITQTITSFLESSKVSVLSLKEYIIKNFIQSAIVICF